MTTELSQLLDEEEKRWTETQSVEEYQIALSKTVIQVSPGRFHGYRPLVAVKLQPEAALLPSSGCSSIRC